MEKKDLSSAKAAIILMITSFIILVIAVCIIVYEVRSESIDKSIDSMSSVQDMELEADVSELVNNIDVKVGDELISYKELTSENIKTGTYDCVVYYESDIAKPKDAYIVYGFDENQVDATYEDGDFVKITVPKN